MNTSNADYVTSLLDPFGPKRPLAELVYEVNKLYHEDEAHSYNDRHREITEQLPTLWREMTSHFAKSFSGQHIEVLDFGCGTGFEAEQVVLHLGETHSLKLVCYDPSPAMCHACESRLAKYREVDIHVTSDLAGALAAQYNLLVTNSLLHHLPDVRETMLPVLMKLRSGGMWLAGHEPSNRFYLNPDCLRVHEEFLARRQPSKYISIGNYIRFIEAKVRPFLVARRAVKAGLFEIRPSATAIDRLVDFSVAHSREEAEQGRGFDVENLATVFDGVVDLEWTTSYSFMGDIYEGSLDEEWQNRAAALRQEYPQDGANFAAVWKRIA